MAGELLARISAEIDQRLRELRPAVAEYERLLTAAGALDLESPRTRPAAEPRPARPAAPRRRPAAPKRRAAAPKREPKAPSAAAPRAPRGAAQQAILAALEHGSHTVSELAVVTAMTPQSIRENLRRMIHTGAVTRARREGKAAYALTGAGAHEGTAG